MSDNLIITIWGNIACLWALPIMKRAYRHKNWPEFWSMGFILLMYGGGMLAVSIKEIIS